MNAIIQPWQRLLTALAGLMNREQQQIIEYLQTENSILKEHLSRKRIRYTDKQRRGLAITEYVAHYHFERNHQGVGN